MSGGRHIRLDFLGQITTLKHEVSKGEVFK